MKNSFKFIAMVSGFSITSLPTFNELIILLLLYLGLIIHLFTTFHVIRLVRVAGLGYYFCFCKLPAETWILH
jgi:hypothetical protein